MHDYNAVCTTSLARLISEAYIVKKIILSCKLEKKEPFKTFDSIFDTIFWHLDYPRRARFHFFRVQMITIFEVSVQMLFIR